MAWGRLENGGDHRTVGCGNSVGLYVYGWERMCMVYSDADVFRAEFAMSWDVGVVRMGFAGQASMGWVYKLQLYELADIPPYEH